jgi:signal transduction histidine kinase
MTELNHSLFPDLKVQKQRTRRLQFILFAVAALLAAGIILVSINSYRNYEVETRSQLERQLDSIATLKSSELAMWYRERMGDAEMLNKSPSLPLLFGNLVRYPASITDLTRLQVYFEALTETYGYESYLVADARGSVMLSFPENAELEPVGEHQAEINEAFSTGEVVFIDFHTHEGESPDKVFLSFVIPVFEENAPHEPLAAIMITINPDDYLYPYISGWPVPRETAETLLVKLDGEEVLFLNPLRFKPDAALSLRIPLDQVEILAVKGLTGQEGIVEGLDYRGRRVIGTIHKVAGTDWVMVSKIDYIEFIAPIQARQERAIFTTTALLLISFAALFIIWRSQQLRYLKAVGRINEELERRVVERTAQLETAKNELEAFAYSVSHDLRAPLRAMSGFSKLLEEEFSLQLGEAGQHYIERIQAASSRMGELIDDLLTLSRVTRSDFTYTQVDLSKLSSEIITKLKEAQPEHQVDVRIQKELTARGDQKLLAIALENLLGNAWKFSSHQPQIMIEVGSNSDDKKQKSFYIRDNGTGFKMDYADKLFIPFQRLHRTDEFPGTGIGLSIVLRIIERHGGRIWAESEVGKGTTFFFTLPV